MIIPYFALIGYVAVIIMFMCTSFALFTVRRKFDKLFSDRSLLLDPKIIGLSAVHRTINYMVGIFMQNRVRRGANFVKAYGHYNFRVNATKFEIIISDVFCISGVIGFVFAVIFFVLHAILKMK